MKHPISSIVTIAVTALFSFGGLTTAQDATGGNEFDWDQYNPFGEIESTYDANDLTDAGAIVLRQNTPGDQHANFDVVGPDGFWEHFDFSDEAGETFVLDDLRPGFYSIAATDQSLQLAHTVVEVRTGESVAVAFTFQTWEAGTHTPGSYDPRGTFGTYDQAEDAYPGYPYGAYDVGSPSSIDTTDTGALRIIDLPEDVLVVVTGPNGYSTEFDGDLDADELVPGVYAIAATGEGMDLSVTTVEIQSGRRLPITPTIVELD